MQVHFAEEWNEIHHLMIMESLGGDQLWIDRFMAQHAAVFYYWVLIFFFAFAPSLAYVFSEMVEVRSSCSLRPACSPLAPVLRANFHVNVRHHVHCAILSGILALHSGLHSMLQAPNAAMCCHMNMRAVGSRHSHHPAWQAVWDPELAERGCPGHGLSSHLHHTLCT